MGLESDDYAVNLLQASSGLGFRTHRLSVTRDFEGFAEGCKGLWLSLPGFAFRGFARTSWLEEIFVVLRLWWSTSKVRGMWDAVGGALLHDIRRISSAKSTRGTIMGKALPARATTVP